jgi:uncharacterized OB-fold protein
MADAVKDPTSAIGERPIQPYTDLDGSVELLEGVNGPALLGTQCSDCRVVMAGAREVCSGCVGQDLQQIRLGPAGILYSYTTMHVSPTAQAPFTLGYVDLEQGARILAPIHGEPASLRCDLPVTLGTDGEEWFFAPSDGTGSNALRTD